MNPNIEPDELLEVRRSLNKASVMKSAEAVINVDLRNINDALTRSDGALDDRPLYSINEVSAGTYTACLFEYAVNGIWTWLDLAPFMAPFEYMTMLPAADWLAELMLCEYREDHLKRNKYSDVLNPFNEHRLRLKCLAALADARSKLDYATNPPGSLNENPDSYLFGVHPDRNEVTLTYLDVSLLSGVSIRSLRNLSSGKGKALNPIKRGRDAVLDPHEIASWLESRGDFQKTRLVDRVEHQQITESDVGPLFWSQILEFPNDN